MMDKHILTELDEMLASLTEIDEKIQVLNNIKIIMHRHSPFKNEPVDCILWMHEKDVIANDYNPNSIATTEKKLLQHSLEKDGFTQPIVASEINDKYIIIDGYHRHEIGKKKLRQRLHGYLPVATINPSSLGAAEQVAMTIRHNRARGKHLVASMSDIVRDLTRYGWSDTRIGAELGMDADEVLRLKQLSGLAELFADEDYTESWTVR